MMMPPHIRATFMPNPPLHQVLPPSKQRKNPWTGVSGFLSKFENADESPTQRIVGDTPLKLKESSAKEREIEYKSSLEPMINEYKQEQRESSGEFEGMNCYNTLFVGRLAYEVTERKLLRELEQFGPVKDLKLIKEQNQSNKSRGYAFVEFEHEEDMKRAYRAADGLRLENKDIVVDVERGHTVPNWLPRRLGGGLGGTRLGGKDRNVRFPGRYDPNKPEQQQPRMGMGRGSVSSMSQQQPPLQQQQMGQQMPPPPHGYGRGGGPPPAFGGGGGGGFGRGRGFGGDRSFGPPRGGGSDRWERHGPRHNDRPPPPPSGGGGGSGGSGSGKDTNCDGMS